MLVVWWVGLFTTWLVCFGIVTTNHPDILISTGTLRLPENIEGWKFETWLLVAPWYWPFNHALITHTVLCYLLLAIWYIILSPTFKGFYAGIQINTKIQQTVKFAQEVDNKFKFSKTN